MFYAQNYANTTSSVVTNTYTIDTTAPWVNANLGTGIYNTTESVVLTANDNLDPNPKIYYTLDGTIPTNNSLLYINPINIVDNSTILKFIAVDYANNTAQVQTDTYIINLPIIDLNTTRVYSSIENATNDISTNNGDVIEISSGTYIDNIIINKSLTIKPVPGNIVTVQAANPNAPIFTINSGGSDSTISGLNINGATGSHGIYINSANNCNIIGNVITNNGAFGINAVGSNLNIINNTVSNTPNAGIVINGPYATVTGNNALIMVIITGTVLVVMG
jgi:parallel beta-helix repeat protein